MILHDGNTVKVTANLMARCQTGTLTSLTMETEVILQGLRWREEREREREKEWAQLKAQLPFFSSPSPPLPSFNSE